MVFFLAFWEELNKKLKILKTTFYFGTLTCLFSFLPMISSDEEPMEVDGGPSSPPTNTAGETQVMEVLSGDGEAMDADEPGPSTAPTNTAGVTLTPRQAVVKGDGAVQTWDQESDQPVW